MLPNHDTTRDDISFLRRIAEEGRYAPLLGGRYLILWGSLVGAAYFYQYLQLAGLTMVPYWTLSIAWALVGIIGGAVMGVFHKTLSSKPGIGSVGNQVERWLWRGVGAAILSFALPAMMAVFAAGASPLLLDAIVGVAFAGYGAAFLAIGKMAKVAWLRWPALGGFVGTGLVPFFAGTPTLYLVATVVVVAIAIVPGLILLRGEPAAAPKEI